MTETPLEARVAELETQLAALQTLTARCLWLVVDTFRRPLKPEPPAQSLDAKVQRLQRQLLEEALMAARGNAAQAARIVGMTHRRFQYLRTALRVPMEES